MEKPRLNHFHTYAEICDYVTAAQKEFPDIMTLDELAHTQEGRVIWGITLAKGNPESHPAVYIQGGIHAEEGMGITGCLNILYTILCNPAILDNLTFYMLPCVNPDGSDTCVTKGLVIRSRLEKEVNKPNAVVPQDINGDGKILSMRWVDPMGAWKTVPECGDMLVPREPGDVEGTFYSTCMEGVVENYDGGELQRGVRNLDFNRQYACNWSGTLEGGDFPGKHIESRTIMSFLTDHRNIFMVFDLHCGTRALIYDLPANEIDRGFLSTVAKMCQQITGIEPVPSGDYARREGNPPVNLRGHIKEFCYDTLGVGCVTVELGNGYNDLGMTAKEIFNGPLYHKELMAQIVAMHKAKGRTIADPWVPFHHPQLGDVEIGGRVYGGAYFMDPDTMLELLPKVTDFILAVSQMAPRLIMGNTECTPIGEKLYRIRTQVMNVGALGTKVMQGATGYNANRDPVQVKLSGNCKILNRQAVAVKSALDSMERMEAEWFVAAEPGETLELIASQPKAGTVCTTLTLQ